MRKLLRFSALLFALVLSGTSILAQSVTLRGIVKASSGETISSVSVTVKDGSGGSYTDADGAFRLTVPRLPVTLVFSSIGYEPQEQTVSSPSSTISVTLVPSSTLGQEVVVSATRTPTRILESPVSVERISTVNIRNAAVPNYYDAVANLKGVDLTTSSQTFRTVSTRGFNGSGNLRLNQLVDGIDNQAPALNFAVGSIVGPVEEDVDNVELLQGASSALYGSGGTNGTLLINSKNPFKYQGLSFNIKQGINHVDGSQRTPAPYYDWSMRWAKTIGERFAFKISGQFVQVQDWQASDTRNLNRQNVFSSLKSGDRQTDPSYDGVNVFGDEASTSMSSFALAALAQGLPPIVQGLTQVYGGVTPTQAQITSAFTNPASIPVPALQAGLTQLRPFYLGQQANVFTGQTVSRTGYDEKYLVDYGAYNVKLNGALHYKITSTTEASLSAYYGIGTTVYTGADRYALRNFKIGQYKAEVKGTNWFLRGYTTQENAGDSYTATTAALYINNAWKSNADWFGQYVGTYAGNRLAGQTDAASQAAARAVADGGRLLPGTAAFNNAFNTAKSITISNGGSKFADKSALYHAEGQYDLSKYTRSVADVLIGGSFRVYHLNSKGTIFIDTAGAINVNEGGAYVQLQRKLLNDMLQITASARYDKNQNFKGRFTPRLSALVRVAPGNNIRLSYQTAYRFPSTQDVYINLLTGGSNRLIGGLPAIGEFFKFSTNPAYTSESVVAYRASVATGTPNPALLKQAQFITVQPERAVSYELGYRGLLTKRLLLDAYGYYCQYKDFIGRVAVGRGQNGAANAAVDLASPFTTNNYSFVVNTSADVNAIGWGLSLNYQTTSGFELSGNISGDQLNNAPAGVATFFNTPKVRGNIGVGKANLAKGFGFNAQWRWQDKIFWEGTFGTGPIPSFSTVDAQITYRLPLSKSSFKLGGSNILNHYYSSAFGNPQVGGIYYISFGYNL